MCQAGCQPALRNLSRMFATVGGFVAGDGTCTESDTLDHLSLYHRIKLGPKASQCSRMCWLAGRWNSSRCPNGGAVPSAGLQLRGLELEVMSNMWAQRTSWWSYQDVQQQSGTASASSKPLRLLKGVTRCRRDVRATIVETLQILVFF